MKKNNNIYVAILVGGSGTRFWPMSRKKMPKQFLNITGDGTLFQKTLRRIERQVSEKNIFIVSNIIYKKEVERQVSEFKIPKSNILLEPEAKNTAPAVCWVSARIHKINPKAMIVVLPSDHLILNQKKYLRTLDEAINLAEGPYLVTLGIVPTRIETGYGYLKTVKKTVEGKKILKVEKFIEKPTLPKARQYKGKKNYFWNSGMFIWRSSVILEEFKTHLPEMYALLKKGPSQREILKIWDKLTKISVDYGILEKAKNVVAVAAEEIDWSDLGSWEAVSEILPKDKEGNTFKGDILQIDTKDSFVWGHKKIIAAIGLKDIIVIDTPDALLVCRKDLSQRVKDVIGDLQKKGRHQI